MLKTALVVAGGGFQGLAILKGLASARAVRSIVADCNSKHLGHYFAARSVVVPRIEFENLFIESLLRICRDERVDIVIPSTQRELRPLAAHAEKFSDLGIDLAVSSLSLLDCLLHKRRLYEWLDAEKWPVLPMIARDIEASMLPVIGKPTSEWGGRGIKIVRNESEMPRDSTYKDYVWQPYIDAATEYSVDVAIAAGGEVSPIVVREREHTSSGFAIISTGSLDKDARKLSTAFVDYLRANGAKGLLNFQLLSTPNGLVISDVNPRIGTSAVYGQGVGVNLPDFLCFPHSCGANKSRAPARQPTMVRYLEERFFSSLQLSGIKAVVFDLDDTLISQKEWIAQKLRLTHLALSDRLPPARDFLLRCFAIIEEGNRSHVFDEYVGADSSLTGLKEELIATYRMVRPTRIAMFPDVLPTLAELQARGYRLGLVTDNPVESQKQKLEVSEIEPWFDRIIYTRELGSEKPATRSFKEMAIQLSVSADEMVMVGDHLYRDAAAAINAGYCHSFLIRRSGSFYNFDVQLNAECGLDIDRVTPIPSLQDLLVYLPISAKVAGDSPHTDAASAGEPGMHSGAKLDTRAAVL